ncbi:MAG: hypothetical protein KA059_05450 [Elusimicrobiales bacterium]|nr:hypothetical protein [Elusimicrobiales bacterium]
MKIKKISINECGPIKKFNFEPSKINLIYGKNESGKSSVVEFIIKSLFNDKSWENMKGYSGSGKIIIDINGSDVELTPQSPKKKKLDEMIEQSRKGLPSSLLKLMVVKEGESNIVKGYSGIDKELIKDMLSSRKILDLILNNLSQTVKNARIEESGITIANQGEGKEYHIQKKLLDDINLLLERVNNEYEDGILNDLEKRKKKLDERKNLLEKARKYRAYILSDEIKKLSEQEKEISDYQPESIRELIRELELEEKNLKGIKIEIDALNKKVERLNDLKKLYEEQSLAKRHLAYTIFKEIERIQSELYKIDEDEINKLEQNISKYVDKKGELESKNNISKEYSEKSKDLKWLESLRERYNNFLNDKSISDNPKLYHTAFIFLLIVSLVLVFISKPFIASVTIVLGFIFEFIYVSRIKSYSNYYKKNEELNQIKKEFKLRFSSDLNSISDLDAIYNDEKKYFDQLELIKNQIESLNVEVKTLYNSIVDSFKKLGKDIKQEQEWGEALSEIKKMKKETDNALAKLRERLSRLDVDENEYVSDSNGVEFKKDEMEKILSEMKRLEPSVDELEKIKIEHEKICSNISGIKKEISNFFIKIKHSEISEYEWKDCLDKIISKKESIKDELNKKLGELNGLGVDEIDYEKENPGVDYSAYDVKSIEEEIKNIDDEIKKEDGKLKDLKLSLCRVTGDDINVSWVALIEHLYSKRKEVQKKLKDLEVIIIAGILINETVNEISMEEDEKILEALKSNDISDYIYKTTGRYRSLSFEGDDIYISDDYNRFPLKDISTGAKEQVMIALRIGFLNRLLKNSPAFLILDDAFEHSDYDKRKLMVNTLFELAKDGWQIIYLTMDDHIKKLFEEKKENFDISYKLELL